MVRKGALPEKGKPIEREGDRGFDGWILPEIETNKEGERERETKRKEREEKKKRPGKGWLETVEFVKKK